MLCHYGYICRALSQYDLEAALLRLEELERASFAASIDVGAWVALKRARAYFEMADYLRAEENFERARELEPCNAASMDYYSTTLWQLNKKVQLSYLAHSLVSEDSKAAESWCAVGNCFSLQKEHQTALQFFRRALQLRPNYAYALTFAGHEYMATDDLESAITAFRQAISMDPRHYNGWYGLGLSYFRQGHFEFARVHFERALAIHPSSAVIYCDLGTVFQEQSLDEDALRHFNRALSLDPKNSTAKFKRASVFVKKRDYSHALKDLYSLKDIAPKEPQIYILLAQVYETLHQPDKAIIHYSTALDLDTKNASKIKTFIEKVQLDQLSHQQPDDFSEQEEEEEEEHNDSPSEDDDLFDPPNFND